MPLILRMKPVHSLEMCERHSWIVPSTFDAYHVGSSDTYVAPRGQLSRLDYIAVSACCQPGIDRSWIDHDIDLMNGDHDHRVLALQMSLVLQRQTSDHIKKVARYDRAAAAVSEHHSQVHIPQLDWGVEVNQHWAHIRDSVRQQCQVLYPKPKRVKRQLYFSQQAWDQLCHRKDLRQEGRRLLREEDSMLLKRLFLVWSCGTSDQADVCACKRNEHIHRLQIALTFQKKLQADQNFRRIKATDWKEWATTRMRQVVREANVAKGTDLYRILKPKQAIQRAKFSKCCNMPGIKDKKGNWCQNKQSIAIAWERQFGELENATATTIHDLWERSQPQLWSPPVDVFLEIPDLFDFEEALRSMDHAKAPGVDAIGAEVWKQDVAIAARHLFPLVVKGALYQQWIVEFSGGWLLPLWKKKGNAQQMETYRGILLEPVLGRAVSRAWRKRLVDSADGWAAMMQWGGRSGLSIEALHLHARLWQSNASAQRQCCALVFVDIKAAFYSVAKPLLAHANQNAAQLQQLFEKFRLPMTAFPAFLHAAQNLDLVRQYTRSDVAANCIRSTLSHSWFAIPNGQAVFAPETGSRPGDPLADLLFSMMMAEILHEINRRQWEDPVFQSNVSDDLCVSQNITWVDDSAFVVQADAPCFVDQVAKMVHHIIDVMAERGVSLSFGQGKTAIIMQFQGKDAGKYKRQFESEHGSHLHLLTEHFGLTKVPVVNHYKHLGGFLIRGGTLLPEIKVRNTQTQAQVKPIRKFLANQHLDLDKRRQLLQSLAIPVMTLHTGAWFDMNVGEREAWHAMVFKTYLALVHRSGQEFPHHTIEELAMLAKQPLPEDLLHIQKIRVFLQIARAGDEQMIDAIHANGRLLGPKSWLAELASAIEWMAQNRGDYDWPDFGLRDLHDLRAWRWTALHYATIKKWLKQAIQAHQHRVATLVRLRQYEKGQKEMLLEWGWTFHGSDDGISTASESAECPDCGQSFKCKADVAVHQQRIHGKRIAIRRYAVDGICRTCCRNFHSRARLIQHLHYGTTTCWIKHMRKYVPLSSDDALVLDEKDRREGVAHHQRGLQENQCGRTWRQATAEEVRDALPLTGIELEGPPTAEEIATWQLIGLLPVAQGGRARSVRKQKGFHPIDAIAGCSLLEQKLVGDVDNWHGTCLVPRPLTSQVRYVLLLFSGHRRYGDVASWLQWDGAVVPISIDVAVHATYGDVHCDDLWIRLIKTGCVVAAHAGPPCETYSAARWIEEPGRLFPRPLRDSILPWGRGNLSGREVKQVSIGTLLMLRTLQILLLVYAYGGAFTLEHPTGDDADTRKWSIWKSGMVRRLLRSRDFQTTRFLQGPLGQPFCKPTTFLSARLPLLDRHLYALYKPGWRPTRFLGGLEDGKWKTAAGKVYPVRLCYVIAQQFLWYNANAESIEREVDLTFLQPALDALAKPWDDYGTAQTTMCRDYHAATGIFL